MRRTDGAGAGSEAARRQRWRASLACGLLAVWVLGLLLWFVVPLARLAPYDSLGDYRGAAEIVRLQLAFTPARADRVLDAWTAPRSDASGTPVAPLIDSARADLAADWWVIMVYTVFGWVTFLSVARWLKPFARDWQRFAWLPVAAGLIDTAENLCLTPLLVGGAPADALLDGRAPADALLIGFVGVLALVKFSLLALTLAAALAVLVFCLWSRRWQADHGAAERPAWLIDLPQVVARERVYLQSRRRRAGLPAGEDPLPVGLALSGGGIRSATLSLGVLQVLGASALWPRIDYLSTVSGGGYIGSTLSSLLSCKTWTPGQGPDDRQQFSFGHGDLPQFGAGGPGDGPFADAPHAGDLPAHRRWLNGRMVVGHLRAFGDFLVRRRRLLDRDVLRAFGITLTGVLSSVVLFAVLLLIPAALILALLKSLGGAEVLAAGPWSDLLGALKALLAATSVPALLAAAGLGAFSTVGVAWVSGLAALRVPADWFRRDGDTLLDSTERRLLWVFGALAIGSGLLVPALLAPLVPGAAAGLALPAAFFGGGLLGGVLVYVMLGARVLIGVRPFERVNRSYHGAIVALFVYFTLAALLLVVLAGLVAPEHPNAMTSMGAGVTAISAAVSAGLAWWRVHHGGANVKNLVAEVRTWYQDAADFLQRLLLGVAVALVLILGLALAIVLVAALVGAVAGGADPNEAPGAAAYLVAAAVVSAVVLLFNYAIDFNALSLHYFYRDRLSEAFLATVARPFDSAAAASPEVKRDHAVMRLSDLHGRLDSAAGGAGAGKAGAGGPPGPKADPKAEPGAGFPCHRLDSTAGRRLSGRRPGVLSEPFAGAATAAPYHLYNTCLNLATERDPQYRSRKSDNFLFSKLYCGSPVTGFVDTGVYGSGEVRVARAMTISGAAVDSALGRDTFFAQSVATTLFNIRLGQWLENPRYQNGRHCWRLEVGVFWPWYLLMEVLGQSHTRNRLVHLSDGGHTGDNLGLVPLLQRRCRLIIAVDGEQDPEHRFGSLMHAIGYVQADMGIRIRIRLAALRPDDAGLTASHYAVGTIEYPATPDALATQGHLVVLKSSVRAADDETVLKYREGHAGFPHQTTADQFFAEDQFEAYRRLGQEMAQQLLTEHPELATGVIDPATTPG